MARKSNHYTNNAALRDEIALSKTAGKITDKLARAIMLIADGMGRKGNWSGYSYVSEMEGEAIVAMLRAAPKFDEAKSDNPFGYLSMCAHNAFIRIWKEHKKQSDIRSALAFAAATSFGHDDTPVTAAPRMRS